MLTLDILFHFYILGLTLTVPALGLLLDSIDPDIDYTCVIDASQYSSFLYGTTFPQGFNRNKNLYDLRCMKVMCDENNKPYMVHCDIFLTTAIPDDCGIKRDYSKPFPDCCPEADCEDTSTTMSTDQPEY